MSVNALPLKKFEHVKILKNSNDSTFFMVDLVKNGDFIGQE